MSVALQQPHVNDSAAAVVAHVRQLIDSGSLGPGARLPPERDLARKVGVSKYALGKVVAYVWPE